MTPADTFIARRRSAAKSVDQNYLPGARRLRQLCCTMIGHGKHERRQDVPIQLDNVCASDIANSQRPRAVTVSQPALPFATDVILGAKAPPHSSAQVCTHVAFEEVGVRMSLIALAAAAAFAACDRGVALADPMGAPSYGEPMVGYGEMLSPPEVFGILRHSRFRPIGPAQRRGRFYVVQAVAPGGEDVRVAVDGLSGRIVWVRPSDDEPQRYGMGPPDRPMDEPDDAYGRPPMYGRGAPYGYGPSAYGSSAYGPPGADPNEPPSYAPPSNQPPSNQPPYRDRASESGTAATRSAKIPGVPSLNANPTGTPLPRPRPADKVIAGTAAPTASEHAPPPANQPPSQEPTPNPSAQPAPSSQPAPGATPLPPVTPLD
jgi:hypothetical protein